MTKKKIHEFRSIEEMAEFWDNHDTTEFAVGEIEPVEYKPKRLVIIACAAPGRQPEGRPNFHRRRKIPARKDFWRP